MKPNTASSTSISGASEKNGVVSQRRAQRRALVLAPLAGGVLEELPHAVQAEGVQDKLDGFVHKAFPGGGDILHRRVFSTCKPPTVLGIIAARTSSPTVRRPRACLDHVRIVLDTTIRAVASPCPAAARTGSLLSCERTHGLRGFSHPAESAAALVGNPAARRSHEPPLASGAERLRAGRRRRGAGLRLGRRGADGPLRPRLGRQRRQPRRRHQGRRAGRRSGHRLRRPGTRALGRHAFLRAGVCLGPGGGGAGSRPPARHRGAFPRRRSHLHRAGPRRADRTRRVAGDLLLGRTGARRLRPRNKDIPRS